MYITEKLLKDWLKPLFDSPSWTIGKSDKSADQSVCVFGPSSPEAAITTVGGGVSGYYPKKFRLLLRWGNNYNKAQEKALVLYELLRTAGTVLIAGKHVSIAVLYSEPIPLGTDDKGTYEYLVEIKTFCER